MSYLLDTNVLLRWVHPVAPEHPLATAAVLHLQEGDEELRVAPQNLVEFWSVATRPAEVNGLGLDPGRAAHELRELRRLFSLVPETPAVFEEWLQLVETYGVLGRQVHDARIAAVMRVHGISHILTLNVGDFNRYPGITVVHPQDVIPPGDRDTSTLTGDAGDEADQGAGPTRETE